MQRKIFITGATGLLGSHLLIDLSKTDDEIIALYRDSATKKEVFALFKYYNLEQNWDRIKWEEGDILDVDRLIELTAGVHHLYHCAALVSFDPSESKKLTNINVEGTRNVLNVALLNKIEKFLHVSSTAAIGKTGTNEKCTELTQWDNGVDHGYYAESKYAAESEVWRAIEEGLNAVIVNPCVILGPGNPKKSSGTLFSTVANGLDFYTMGANAFVDVKDVSAIMYQLMNSEIHSERFLCVGENLSFRDIFSIIADEMGKKKPSKKANKWMTGIAWRLMKVIFLLTGKSPKVTSESAKSSHKITRFSNQKIRDSINFKFTPIEDAVKNTVDYMKFSQRL
jgi:nucleoside-diphosphate-sugar epimerase